MLLVEPNSFRPPPLLGNPHIQTVLPALFRRIRRVPWRRERLGLVDGDFLDLDWLSQASPRLLIISHGLEGSSRGTYVVGLARAAARAGWDVLAWNFRGCSGEMNRLPRFYHSGATEDLAAVVMHAVKSRQFRSIAVAGFSLGGNLTLKFLGEGNHAAEHVQAGVAISVPCDLKSSAERMAQPACAFYMRRFRRDILAKWERKRRRFPQLIPRPDPTRHRTFRDLDDVFTAPIHGFGTAERYWAECSANAYLAGIRRPVLVINAQDDPFLTPECHPIEAARRSDLLHLELTTRGGHVGFLDRFRSRDDLWSERRAVAFLESVVRAEEG
jgi:predicted alpha/beta-fold hydrolase